MTQVGVYVIPQAVLTWCSCNIISHGTSWLITHLSSISKLPTPPQAWALHSVYNLYLDVIMLHW